MRITGKGNIGVRIIATMGFAGTLLLCACSKSEPPQAPAEPAKTAAAALPAPNADKNAYFGDLHVHTGRSFDAFVFGVRATPDDAYRCFMRTEMDTLVLENFVLNKAEQKPLEQDVDWRKEFVLD